MATQRRTQADKEVTACAMPYSIRWDNPAFPIIIETPYGDLWLVVARTVAMHHIQASLDHLKAAERLIDGVQSREN